MEKLGECYPGRLHAESGLVKRRCMTVSLFEQAVALGQLVAQSEEYQQLQAAEAALRQDQEAWKLVKDFKDLKKSYDRMQMLGHEITEKSMEKLREAEQKAAAHPVFNAYRQAGEQFYAVMDQVNAKIWEGITGQPIEVSYMENQAAIPEGQREE